MSDQQIVNGEKVDGRGGKREGAGRPAGAYGAYSKNNLQRLCILAQQHTENAIARIVEVMNTAENPMVVLAAAGMILDRGYGRSRDYIEVNTNETVSVRYETISEAREKLLAAGIPLDKLGQPKLIEHEPSADET